MIARLAVLWARVGAHALGVAVACALVICAVIAWPTPVHDSRTVTVPAAVVRADSAAAKAETVYVHRADTLYRRAMSYDSARAHVPDFATADVYGAVPIDTGYVVTADSLRRACTLYEDACMKRHAADSAQVAALRLFTVDLQRDLAHSEPRCRVLGLPCPSRKTAFEGGVALGVLLVVAVAAHR